MSVDELESLYQDNKSFPCNTNISGLSLRIILDN